MCLVLITHNYYKTTYLKLIILPAGVAIFFVKGLKKTMPIHSIITNPRKTFISKHKVTNSTKFNEDKKINTQKQLFMVMACCNLNFEMSKKNQRSNW